METLVATYAASRLIPPLHYINTTELALFNAWRTTNNVTWHDVGLKICNFLLAKHGNMIPFSGKQLRPEDFTCQTCMLAVLRDNFVSWWIHERESTGFVDNRVKCWHGRGCRTQVHNHQHAVKLIHACHETPAASRQNNAPPRDGGMAAGPEALGDILFGGGGVMSAAVIVAGAEDGDAGPAGGGAVNDGGNGIGGGDAGGGAGGGE